MNLSSARKSDTPESVSLHTHAMDNLAFIRKTMVNSSAFTAVSGVGMMAMGLMALVGAWIATRGHSFDWWINTWTAVAFVGCITGGALTANKTRRRKTPVLFGPARKFAVHFSPAIIAGIILSQVLYAQELDHLLPTTWLLLYGVAVVNGGAFSVPLVPIMGLCFMFTGLVTAFLPNTLLDVSGTVRPYDMALAFGFGGLHLIFGLLIAVRYRERSDHD